MTGLAAGLAFVSAWLLLPSQAGQLRRLRVRSGRQKVTVSRGSALAAVGSAACIWLAAHSILGPFTVPIALVVGSGAAWGFQKLEPRQAKERRVAVGRDLPLTLDLLAACLEAGAPIRTAVQRVSALAPESTAVTLRQLDDAVRLGVNDAVAWQRLQSDQLWGPIAADVIRCLDTGAAAHEVLVEHASESRAAETARRLAAARTVGVHSVLPLMTCFLPAFMLVGVVPIVAGLVTNFLHR